MVEAGHNGRTEVELRAKTGVDEILLRMYSSSMYAVEEVIWLDRLTASARLLRTLAFIGLLSRLDEQRWVATPLTQVCTIPTVRSGYKFM